jgi:hypothetical protein
MSHFHRKNHLSIRSMVRWVDLSSLCLLAIGCTSLGHSGREVPLIAKPIGHLSEITLDGDDNELSIAIEKALDASGVDVHTVFAPEVTDKTVERETKYNELKTRYVVQVSSKDGDKCLPEGSRQMDFNIVVTDYREHKRVLVMHGEYGCKDSIVRQFMKWLGATG